MTRTSKPPCPAFKHFVTALSSTMSMIILQIKVGTAAGTYHHSAAAAAAAAAAAVAAAISLTQAPKACLTSAGACHFPPPPPSLSPLLWEPPPPQHEQQVVTFKVARVELTRLAEKLPEKLPGLPGKVTGKTRVNPGFYR